LNGFILINMKVKIFLFLITVLTGYITPYYSSLGMFLFFEVVIATVGTIATLTWIFFVGLLQKTYIKHYRVVNIILAILLLQCAVALYYNKSSYVVDFNLFLWIMFTLWFYLNMI